MWMHNINGSSDRSPNCKCGSWKNHWLMFSGAKSWPTHCSVKGCSNSADVGAHVQYRANGNWYIVPMCSAHNNMRGKSVDLRDDTITAIANRSQTCD